MRCSIVENDTVLCSCSIIPLSIDVAADECLRIWFERRSGPVVAGAPR